MQNKQVIKRRKDLLDTAFGEVILNLLADKDIIEVILNPDGKLWAESLSKGKFNTAQVIASHAAENMVKLVAAQLHLVVNYDHPEVACELAGIGARFQGWLPPVTTRACFTIRKHTTQILMLDDYVLQGALTQSQLELLHKAIKNKLNIIIAGGTGSGKTTFANALLSELAQSDERVIILEDLPELKIDAPDFVKLRTTETKSMRDLVKGVLRMRPDRIIIGEVRDGAALELLKAWNTGHPGGVCTLHANSAAAVFDRLEDLIQEVVSVVPKRLIDQAVDMVVFIQRDKKSGYKVKEILET